VLVIIMIIFGAGKLPEIAKSLGQGVKEFRAEAEASPATRTVAATNAQVAAHGALDDDASPATRLRPAIAGRDASDV